ncbi:MAG: A/G-specific adenine glycosylase [Moraxella sp.]|nr:A/G-specific adenine glycosylase [Moraxella sp.]
MTQHPYSTSNINTTSFAERILTWFDVYGRHDLPWQQHHKSDKDIYAVWLSEIMLQQTQVTTVRGYFERFITRFPTVQDLAVANWDEVAELWAGLGYYARARNLHAAAHQLCDFIDKHQSFPQTIADWQNIKGVGRSTAGAIVAMGVGGFGVICDGNVKRVLTRWAGVDDDITKSSTDKRLWELATTLTPLHDSGRYAQAMMDMGATLCTRTKPKCHACPIADDCTAHQQGNPTAYPVKSKKPAKPIRHSHVLFIQHNQHMLWVQRPNDGIWGGLWCTPLHTLSPNDMADNLADCTIADWLLLRHTLMSSIGIKHSLTHFYWQLDVCTIVLNDKEFYKLNQILDNIRTPYQWLDDTATNAIAKPAALVKLLTKLTTNKNFSQPTQNLLSYQAV